jgi:hypothetical protein
MSSSVNIIGVFNSGRIRWAVHVAHVGERRYVCSRLVRTAERKRSLGRHRRMGRYRKRRLKKYDETELIGFIWLRTGISDMS